MSTFKRTLRLLSLPAVVAILSAYSLTWGNAPLAQAQNNPPELSMGVMYKWDPNESPNSTHTYKVEIKKNHTTLIGVLAIGVNPFQPQLISSTLQASPAICGGRPIDTLDTHDVLISCSATNATEGTYTFTVKDSAGNTPTRPYAIFAKRVNGLSRITTQTPKTKGDWDPYKVEIYEYMRVATTSRVSLSVNSDQPVVGRMYEDNTTFICEAPGTCAVDNSNVQRYFVVLWNLQGRSDITVTLQDVTP